MIGLKGRARGVDAPGMTTTRNPFTVQRGTLMLHHRTEADALDTANRLVSLGHSVVVYDRRDPETSTTRLRPLDVTS